MASTLRRRQPETDTEATVFAWNQQHPVGQAVEYRPILGQVNALKTRTASVAWLLSGHTAVVKIEGVSGGVALREAALACLSEAQARLDQASALLAQGEQQIITPQRGGIIVP